MARRTHNGFDDLVDTMFLVFCLAAIGAVALLACAGLLIWYLCQ